MMRTLEAVYRGVRETERKRIAIVILVHMLFTARQARALRPAS